MAGPCRLFLVKCDRSNAIESVRKISRQHWRKAMQTLSGKSAVYYKLRRNVQAALWVVPSPRRRGAGQGGSKKWRKLIRGRGEDGDPESGEGLGEGVVIGGGSLIIQGEKAENGNPA